MTNPASYHGGEEYLPYFYPRAIQTESLKLGSDSERTNDQKLDGNWRASFDVGQL